MKKLTTDLFAACVMGVPDAIAELWERLRQERVRKDDANRKTAAAQDAADTARGRLDGLRRAKKALGANSELAMKISLALGGDANDEGAAGVVDFIDNERSEAFSTSGEMHDVLSAWKEEMGASTVGTDGLEAAWTIVVATHPELTDSAIRNSFKRGDNVPADRPKAQQPEREPRRQPDRDPVDGGPTWGQFLDRYRGNAVVLGPDVGTSRGGKMRWPDKGVAVQTAGEKFKVVATFGDVAATAGLFIDLKKLASIVGANVVKMKSGHLRISRQAVDDAMSHTGFTVADLAT